MQKKGRMKRLVAKLRDRVASLQLKIDQLHVDNEALRYNCRYYKLLLQHRTYATYNSKRRKQK